jgi:hypothetical protein
MYYFLGAEYFASEAHSSVPCLCLWSQIETMSPNKRIVVGDRVTIAGGSHVCWVGTVWKVSPRSYHIQFDVMEKPQEKSPSCIRFWNVKLVPDPPCAPAGAAVPAHVTSGVIVPPTRKKKRVETVSSDAVAQVVLPVLKTMPELTKEEWAILARAVENLFI